MFLINNLEIIGIFKDKNNKGGVGICKSIYIRSRRAYDKFASTLCLFSLMVTWCGTHYSIIDFVTTIVI